MAMNLFLVQSKSMEAVHCDYSGRLFRRHLRCLIQAVGARLKAILHTYHSHRCACTHLPDYELLSVDALLISQ